LSRLLNFTLSVQRQSFHSSAIFSTNLNLFFQYFRVVGRGLEACSSPTFRQSLSQY
ncbi:hypothetical protein L9F63_015923, partial [Diploptera punctata]